MKTMYPAQVNSPGTELAGAIDAAQDTIQVADGSVLPDGPNLLTIGTDEAAETILYTGKTGDELTGVTRGFQGTAQSWAAGTKVARYFTAYDHDAAVSNISELSAGLKALGDAARDRLDIVERQDVELNAGLQILNAQRRAAFFLSGIKGRTLANRLGRNGSLDTKANLGEFQVDLFVETTDKVQGTGSLKVTLEAGKTIGAGYIGQVSYESGKYYIIVADAKNIDATDGCYIGVASIAGAASNVVKDKTKWTTIFLRFNSATNLTSNLDLVVKGSSGQSALFDAVRVYEISKTDYDEIPNLTPEQVAAKYPYVDSVTPVRNPYALRYGENLLPPFYEWRNSQNHTRGSITEPYYAEITGAAGLGFWYEVDIPVIPNQAYHLSGIVSEANKLYAFAYDSYGNAISSTRYSGSFTTPTEAASLRIYANTDTSTNIVTFKNPMLNIGSTAKPFKPREDSMLALQTELYADPLTGANADEVFEKDGQYFKLAKWKKVAIDDLIGKYVVPTNQGNVPIGAKVIYIEPLNLPDGSRTGAVLPAYMTKFNGSLLKGETDNANLNAADEFLLNSAYQNKIQIVISNTDSGWGDNYTPTADESKACFMGWKMFEAGVGTPYNGTGTKYWGKIYCGVGSNDGNGMVAGSGVSTLPTTMNDMGYTPYQLVYQLATPTVEPVVSEGMLTFNEGDNQVEVGTGIVLREDAKPSKDNNNVWNIGNPVANSSAKGFKYKARSIMSIYKNSIPDVGWTIAVTPQYGALAQIKNSLFDSSAAYSATYLMLDKSPIVPFTGSYAANEKAMLQELTDAVQQNTTAVNVLMQQKIEKGEPIVWVKPTLLNGWTSVASEPLRYTKVGSMVQVGGRVAGGNYGAGALMFRFPAGLRPLNSVTIPVYYSTGSTAGIGEVVIGTDGSVLLYIGGNSYLDCANITFIAEW